MQDNPFKDDDGVDPIERIHSNKHIFNDPKPLEVRPTHTEAESKPWPKHIDSVNGSETLFYLSHPQLASEVKFWKQRALKDYQRCDLHGQTQAEAFQTLCRAIQEAKQAQRQTLLFIHGKSLHNHHAPIKSMLAGELKVHRDVLAYWTAPPSLGGTGALICIIKKNKEPYD